jgi:hypothetical protein
MWMISGSVLVPAMSHAFCNGIGYPLIWLWRKSRRPRYHRNSSLQPGNRAAQHRAGNGLSGIDPEAVRGIDCTKYVHHFIDLHYSAAILPAARMIG